MKCKKVIAIVLLFLAIFGSTQKTVQAQDIAKLIVEIRTSDVRFAGTDDDIHLLIGGYDFYLDNPDKDDFERGNTDRFELYLDDSRLGVELIRAIGVLTVIKTEDSFWGGGWKMDGISVWVNSDAADPIYRNYGINKWLDGSDLQWQASLSDPGWNLPEPQPFPPCLTGDVDLGIQVDSDCDGVADEDDLTFDEPDDADGDGLPDRYEEQTSSDPLNPDSDGDGWWDGRNRRSFLILTTIECLDEREDAGRDEIYLVSEDVRFPAVTTLDGNWPLNDGSIISPHVAVDTRVSGPDRPGAPPLSFKSRMRLREKDFEIFEMPTDDTYKVFEVTWGENEAIEVVHDEADSHYVLSFQSYTLPFGDPTVISDGDEDSDGLTDSDEFLLTIQDTTVQPVTMEGYNGLADPDRKELFVEIDAAGSKDKMPFDTKLMVASQFYYHGISPRFDDGYLGGGEILSYEQEVTMDELMSDYRPSHFWSERSELFRYGLFAAETAGEGNNGVASGTNFIVSRATLLGQFSPIVLMHEIGHTLSLCHPGGERGATVSATCPTPSDWEHIRCTHYCGVGDQDITAMGSDIGGDSIIAGAAAGALIGALIGYAIGGFWGAVVGGIIGGLVGSFLGLFNSDAYQRVVDFHPIEWDALRFW